MSSTNVTRRGFLQSTSLVAGAALVGTSATMMQPPVAVGQTRIEEVGEVLKLRLQSEDVVDFQIRQYLMKRVPPLPAPKTASEWTTEETRLRAHLLKDVIFHGWPSKWVDSPPRFEDLGLIPSGKGYRLRKLRYEIVPGFWTTALLYEPETPKGRMPATINLNGHAPNGKAADYKQKRCINNALQGIYALSLEWLGMGESAIPENNHWNGAHLDLVGLGATGLFYLAIRKGLDYLCQHPNVDPLRIGATGLSGGAWQTIIIASLDERIAVAVAACGYFSFTSAIERNSDVGDLEYHPSDLFIDGDYSTLTAMTAPRATLLMYGAEDQYGLRAALQKPHLYDEIRPIFRLYGKEDNLAFYENVDPGTHNYELDNREHAYAFFTKHFNIPVVEHEVPVDAEVKSFLELLVGLPKDNLSITGLARKIASGFQRPEVPSEPSSKAKWASASRSRLKEVVRFKPVTIWHAWPLFSTRNKGLRSIGYRLEFDNELSATAIWLKSTTCADNAPLSILLDDSGLRSVQMDILTDPVRLTTELTSPDNAIPWHINRGEQALAVNLIFTGDASPDFPKNEPVHVAELYSQLLATPAQIPGVRSWLATRPPSALYGLLLSASGDRPLGMEAAQLLGIADWVRNDNGVQSISIETQGIRNQVTALVASAMEPSHFSALSTRGGMNSLQYLLDHAIRYQDAPDLFCLDLYKDFDIDILAELAEPTKVTQQFMSPQSN